jgi:glutamyl-Q tRNA(Asp) synthetase
MSTAPLRDRQPGGAYVGRFAPSPTGPLHAGSLVAALASWLDARAHGGRWLVRIEDVDTPRCVAGADALILAQLARCGLLPDEVPVWQSSRSSAYQAALDSLLERRWAYPCACSRSDIEAALRAQGVQRSRHEEWPYPGTCRCGLHGKAARSVRMLAAAGPAARTPAEPGALTIDWADRRLGAQQQNVTQQVGDFVLKRGDGLWAYQLGVVVDDAEQGVTHVVRGEDLADNTARQIHLQRALSLPTPAYLHTPLVLGDGLEKLSKQTGAKALELIQPWLALRAAAGVLGLDVGSAQTVDRVLAEALAQWRARWLA